MRWTGVFGVFVGLLLLAGAAGAAAPPTETRYVAALRLAAGQVDTSLAELKTLAKGSATLPDAGARLAAAAGSSCAALRAYQNATTRFGTDEENALVQKVQAGLSQARLSYGTLTGVTLPGPTAKQQSAGVELVRTLAATAANGQIARWVGDQGLADVLTAGDLKQVRAGLKQELTRRLDAAQRNLSRRAVGFSLVFGSPLKTQVQSQLDQAALNWLAKTVLRFEPTGLALQLVGVPIVRLLRTELQAALRDHKHVTARTDRTVAGFTARTAELQALVDGADSVSLASARRSLAHAQRALDATTYLRSDLQKQGRKELIARLDAAGTALTAKIKEARAALLLDSPLARSNLRGIADGVCKLQGEIAQIKKKASSKVGGSIIGTWTAAGGAMQVTATGATTYEGRTVKPYTFCHSGSVPLGQVEWKLTRTAPNKYTGTVRYYKVSDCTYIGDAQNATWEYKPADDTLYACSYSPNPSIPGGGCSTEHRVK